MFHLHLLRFSTALKEGQIYNITNVMISLFNYEHILKTTERTTVTVCEDDNVDNNISDEQRHQFGQQSKKQK